MDSSNISIEVFYGPYFLPVVSLIFIVSGIYSLITKKVLIPPRRHIRPEWMAGRWAIIWGVLQVIAAILFMAIYLQRGKIYNP